LFPSGERRVSGYDAASVLTPSSNSTRQPEPLFERVYRFVRALIVGGAATLADVTVLTTCLHVLGWSPTVARLPALLTGASVQFFGNRRFTFRAHYGRMTRQAKVFALFESAALLANWGVFSFIAPRLRAYLPPEIASFIGTFIVFVGFSYPMRRLVIFRLTPDEESKRDDCEKRIAVEANLSASGEAGR
jgi:putative flippase GtrA